MTSPAPRETYRKWVVDALRALAPQLLDKFTAGFELTKSFPQQTFQARPRTAKISSKRPLGGLEKTCLTKVRS